MLIKEEFSDNLGELLISLNKYKVMLSESVDRLKPQLTDKNSNQEWVKYKKQTLKAAILLISCADGIVSADDSGTYSKAMNDFQNVINLFPDLLDDPGYDENGSL